MDGIEGKLGALPVGAVVAVPIQNEVDRIGGCLAALARQEGAGPFAAVLLVNNTTDGTAELIRSLLPILPFRATVVEHEFPPELRSAGHARQMAMFIAAMQAVEGAAVLCTDADGQVAPDWLANNLRHLRAGADAVAGRITVDPIEAALIPQHLHDADAQECAYADLLDELDTLMDPDPADPWPRHTEHSGASICVTLDAFREAGGIPAIPAGEDRAFFDALRRIDARIRHAPDVMVTVSGRLQGRAKGGMADTIRRRMVKPDDYLDDRLEPADAAWRRLSLRRNLRQAYAQRVNLHRVLSGLCDPANIRRWSAMKTFGALWAEVQASVPDLQRQLVPVQDLPAQMARATYLRGLLQRQQAGAALHVS